MLSVFGSMHPHAPSALCWCVTQQTRPPLPQVLAKGGSWSRLPGPVEAVDVEVVPATLTRCGPGTGDAALREDGLGPACCHPTVSAHARTQTRTRTCARAHMHTRMHARKRT